MLFPSGTDTDTESNHCVLIRVPRVASRSRKVPSKAMRRTFPSAYNMPPTSESTAQTASIQKSSTGLDDFAPSDDGSASELADSDSGSDFDIFSESKNKSRAKEQRNDRQWAPSLESSDYPKGTLLGESVSLPFENRKAQEITSDSDDSFDIFEPTGSSGVRRQSSTFAPSDGEA